MSALSKRYAEVLARLKALEAKQQLLFVRSAFANPRRFCPTCQKDVMVTVTTRGGVTTRGRTEVSAVCVECGADLKDVKKSNAAEGQ